MEPLPNNAWTVRNLQTLPPTPWYTTDMIVARATIILYAPWVRSLKEKRAEVKSLVTKVRHKFNASVAEVDNQDIHQTIAIGIAAVTASGAQADSVLDNIINFIETNSEAQIVSIDREMQ